MTASRSPDLVSYARKHNEANGEDNRDGSDDNHSANWGVEGPTDDPDDRRAARSRAPQPAGLAVPGAGRAAAARRRRGRQQPERQQQCLLPGQRDRLGRLVRPRATTAPTSRDLIDQLVAACAAPFRSCRAQHWLRGHGCADGSCDVKWLTPAGDRDDTRRTGHLPRRASSPMCSRRAPSVARRCSSCSTPPRTRSRS